MTIKKFALATAAAILFAVGSGAASAATIMPATFNFTTGGSNNVSDGNARFYSATSPQLGTYRVRITGWSIEGTTVRDSRLMVYDGGLGVLSGDDGNGDGNRHTVDNHTRKDFLLLQFDRQVELTSATFNTYGVMGSRRDSDATIAFGVTDAAWNSSLGLNNQSIATLAALFDGAYSSLTSSEGNSTRNINPDRFRGNLWLIGADFANVDHRIDGFKLGKLAVVPEPATWAMMIGGFGLVGAAMRRRSAPVRVIA